CPHCTKGFKERGHLKVHIESVHLGIRWQCPCCDRVYSGRKHCVRHMKKHHPGDVKANCPIRVEGEGDDRETEGTDQYPQTQPVSTLPVSALTVGLQDTYNEINRAYAANKVTSSTASNSSTTQSRVSRRASGTAAQNHIHIHPTKVRPHIRRSKDPKVCTDKAKSVRKQSSIPVLSVNYSESSSEETHSALDSDWETRNTDSEQ
ncbi:hypothetical protein KIPB_013406, partial [Kipferlia bialata]